MLKIWRSADDLWTPAPLHAATATWKESDPNFRNFNVPVVVFTIADGDTRRDAQFYAVMEGYYEKAEAFPNGLVGFVIATGYRQTGATATSTEVSHRKNREKMTFPVLTLKRLRFLGNESDSAT